MKVKFLTIISGLLLVTVLSASAQKGKFYLSGSVGLRTFDTSSAISGQSPTNFGSTQFSLTPEVGFFLKDDLQLGVMLGYNQTSSESGGFFESEDSENVFAPGLYLRKLFAVNDKLAFHVGLGTSLNNGSGDRKSLNFSGEEDIEEYTVSGFAVNLPVGVMYQLSKKVTFIASYDFISYTSRTEQIDGMDDRTIKNLDVVYGAGVENAGFAPLTAGFFFVLN
jgi:hypothetical protein